MILFLNILRLLIGLLKLLFRLIGSMICRLWMRRLVLLFNLALSRLLVWLHGVGMCLRCVLMMFGVILFVRFVMVCNITCKVRLLLIGVILVTLMICVRLLLVRLLVYRNYGIWGELWTRLIRLVVLFDLNIMMLVENRPTLPSV